MNKETVDDLLLHMLRKFLYLLDCASTGVKGNVNIIGERKLF